MLLTKALIKSVLSMVAIVVASVSLTPVSTASALPASTCSVASTVHRDPTIPAMAAFRAGTWYVRGTVTSGSADVCFVFGQAGDQPVIGDWNGDGEPTPGFFRPSTGTWYLSNSTFAQSGADIVVHYGSPGDMAYPGNFNHGSRTTVGVYRPSTTRFYLRTSNTDGIAEGVFQFGNPGDIAQPEGLGILNVYRPSTGFWYFGQTLDTSRGYDAFSQHFGQSGDIPVAGPWSQSSCGILSCFNGSPAAGVYRPATRQWLLSEFAFTGSPQTIVMFGDPGDTRIGLPAWRAAR